jgi:pimeloyl-ACP methyl ester carboxylesterase
MSHLWKRLRRAWAILGTVAGVGFVGWCLVAYRANAEGRRAAMADASVAVVHAASHWRFVPTHAPDAGTGLVFFSGALVDPRAYAGVARRVAETGGYPVVVVELPRRGAFGAAAGGEVLARAREAMATMPGVACWVVGGHSRGGEVASRFVSARGPGLVALLLAGTSHPRDIDLSGLPLPVTKLVATRDGLASPERNARNRHNLPASTRWVSIEGGNHSQFADYGLQPGDRIARIPRAAQHAVLLDETLRLLHRGAAQPACGAASRARAR